MVVVQGVYCFGLHAFFYPWIAQYVSIPNLASIGMAIQLVSYIGMGAINNLWGNIGACCVLWIGYCFGTPTSASILTVNRLWM